MLRCVAAAALLQASRCAADVATAVSAAVSWGDCAFSGATDSAFACATLRVPLCHETAPCESSRVHELELFRRQASKDPNAPTVWLASESESASQTADLMERIAAQVGGATINVYALHLRLWNASLADSLLYRPCQSLAHDFGDRVFIENATLTSVAECQSWINTQIGPGGSNAYSLTNAASDLDLALELVQAQELQSNSNVYLMAIGKASRVVNRLIALGTKSSSSIAGFIFDTPHGMKLQTDQDAVTGSATSRYLSGCESDATCRSKFASLSMSMSEELETMLTTLDKSPDSASKCLTALKDATYVDSRDLKLSHGVRRFFTTQRRVPRNMKLTAPLLYRTHRCGSKDGETLTTLLNHMKSTVQPESMSMDLFVERLVAYSELWPSSIPSQQQLTSSFEANPVDGGLMASQLSSFCAYTASDSVPCKGVYRRSPEINSSRVLTYVRPSLSNSSVVDPVTGLSVPKSTDVLIFTSRLSTEGSSFVAKQQYDLFAGKQSSDQVAVLVESDNLLLNEMESNTRDTLLKLVGLFVTENAKGFAGSWHIKDLDGVDWTKTSASPKSKSTYSTAPVSLNFTRTEDEEREAPLKFGSDLYEYVIPPKRGRIRSDDEDQDSGVNPLVYAIAIGAPLIFFARVWYVYRKSTPSCCCCCRRRPPRELTQTPVPETETWPQPYFHQPQPTAWPSQQLQPMASHSQSYQPTTWPPQQLQQTHWGGQRGSEYNNFHGNTARGNY